MLLTGLLGKTGVLGVAVGGGICVCVGGGVGEEDKIISKLKGAGSTHALPRSYLHVSCLL